MEKLSPLQTNLALLKDWQQKLHNDSLMFSEVLQKNFHFGLTEAYKTRQEDPKELQGEVLAAFTDTLVSTAAGICCRYVSLDPGFEEQIIGRMREVFAEMRKLSPEEIKG